MFTSSAILSWMLLLPLAGGVSILLLPGTQARRARLLGMGFAVATLILAILAAVDWHRAERNAPGGMQLETRCVWMPMIGGGGPEYHVGVDGVSAPLILVAAGMMVVACWVSRDVAKAPRGYFALLLLLLAGTIGVFVSLDLVLFCVFFIGCAIPVSLLVSQWPGLGGSSEVMDHAGLKLLVFNAVGAVALMVAAGAIYVHAGTLDWMALRGRMEGAGFLAFWLLVVAFGVRVPLFPLHLGLVEGVARARTPVAMVLNATLIGTGGYGLLRVCYGILPTQARESWFYVALIAVVTIVYGALAALGSKDLKQLVAYVAMSVSGGVVLGLAVMQATAWAGAVMGMVGLGLGGGLVYLVVGAIEERAKQRVIGGLGGVGAVLPALGGWGAMGFMALIGFPGFAGFVGMLLVLLGTFAAGAGAREGGGGGGGGGLGAGTGGGSGMGGGVGGVGGWGSGDLGVHGGQALAWLGGVALLGLVMDAGCCAWTYQRVFMGVPRLEHQNFPKLTRVERWALALLCVASVAPGVMPALVLDGVRPVVEGMLRIN